MSRLHDFTLGAMPSAGLTGAAITGMRYGVPRLVNGLARDLFREDAADLYQDLLAFDWAELRTLESATDWIDGVAAKALANWEKLLVATRQSLRRAKANRPKRKMTALRDTIGRTG